VKLRSSVVEAVGFGHEAAVSIDRYLRGADLRSGRDSTAAAAEKPEGPVELIPRKPEETIPPEERRGTFNELLKTLTPEEAIAEAKRCLNCGICSECMQCFLACEPNAIFHYQRPVDQELDIGALIVAPGFEPFDAANKPEFGYERFPNVITGPEFERLLSASGPCGGEQCVGSRDRSCGNEYCSSVCCMYATKQAIVAREHEGDELEATIFYNDIRAMGKGFERYYASAESESKVRYVKCIVSSVKQMLKTNNLLVTYVDDENNIVEEEVELVVLSVGLVPNRTTSQLYDRIGLSANAFGFSESDPFLPGMTDREGVFVCGAADSPIDIPESVVQAGCAAALAGELLSEARGTLISPKIFPEERPSGDEARVGVFICHCGTNIARVVDVESLTQFAARLPGVVHAEQNLYTCATDTTSKIVETIVEKGINRVVVSSCTPRTHEPLFQDMIREAGLNRYLFEMANIRDQCSWVHANTPDLASDKAKDLVAMAVERAKTLEPLSEIEYGIEKSALVIGGGPAGMTAALSIALQGYKATIVEKAAEVGGNLRKVQRLIDGRATKPLLEGLSEQVNNHPLVKLITDAQIIDAAGHIGEFHTTVRSGGEETTIDHGVVVFATGAKEYQPVEYLYGSDERVLTQSELEDLLVNDEPSLQSAKSVVMVQCVGSREEPHNYCSRICCQGAVKNALRLKELDPEIKVYVLYRDMRTYGFSELYYAKAREKGVIFLRYDLDSKPEVRADGDHLEVGVLDTSIGRTFTLIADRLVLSAAIRADETVESVLQLYKAPVNEDGFLFEAHPKLRPIDFANEGMFMAGFAHGPKPLNETIAQAKAAAARAVAILSKDTLYISGAVAVVDEERCAICLTCVRECPYEVPKINENNRATIDAASCQGCGICAAACPARAIDLRHYKDGQILAKCHALELRRELEHVGR
jgi:heterodisulfide reductase subunit A-like polyferredoxin